MASASGLSDPITLSGLNFGPSGLSGMGQPGAGGLSGLAGGEAPGIQGGPGLDILSLLNMLTQGGGATGVGADQGVINTSPLTSPISGTLSQPSSLQYGIAGNTGAGGMTGFSGQQTGTTGGTGGGTADPLSTLMKLLGLGSQASGIAAQLQQAGGLSPASTGGPQISAQTGTASPTIGGAEQTLTPTDNPFQNFLNMFPQGLGGTSPSGALPFDAQMGNPAFGPEQLQQLEGFEPMLRDMMTQGSFGPEGVSSAAGGTGGFNFGELGGILGTLQSLLGFGKSAASGGNPTGTALSGIQSASQLSNLLGGPSISSLVSSLLPETATEAAIASAGGIGEAGGLAAGAAGGIPTGAAALAGVTMAPFITSLSNWLMGIGPPSGKMHETASIRRDFGKAWPQLQGGAQAYQSLQNVNALPPEQQVPALQQILRQAQQALGAGAAVSQYLSTQGGRHGAQSSEGLGLGNAPGVKALDVSPFEKQSGPLVVQAQLARYAAEDALRARGVDPGQWFNISPEADVRGLARMAGVPYNLGETGDVSATDIFGNPVTIQRPLGQLYNANDISAGQGYAAFGQGGTPTNYNLSPADIAGLQAGPNRLKNLFDFYARLSPGFADSLVGQFAGGVPQDLFGMGTPA